ncbi:MAG TPA: DUF4258 domain-containing protein [Patescibacteria group bacterium]|nr:DUF4258 domain-containing protein [Patescibacteria group bacterium]
MKYRFTKHALDRMGERGLAKDDVIEGIESAGKIHSSTKVTTRFIAKKLYKTTKGQHVLLIIFEKSRSETLVVTVIDTSKVQKYY